MAKIKGAIVVDTERCKGCNLCVVACPLHVIALNAKQVNKKRIHIRPRVLNRPFIRDMIMNILTKTYIINHLNNYLKPSSVIRKVRPFPPVT